MFKIGIIGQGRSGYLIHVAALLKMTDKYKIVAICDKIEDRRKRAEEEFGARTYENYLDMIANEELDIVVNASYSQDHFPISLDLVKKGYTVVSEKPFCANVKEADELIKADAESAGRIFPFQQSRFAPFYEKAKELIDSGTFGRVSRITISYGAFGRRWDWQTIKEWNAGNLKNTGPHPLDQALTFFPENVMPKVFAHLDNVTSFGNSEDCAKVILTAPNCPLVEVDVSAARPYPAPVYKVEGSNGGFESTMSEAKWKYFKTEDAPKQALTTEPILDENGLPGYCTETLPWIEETCKYEGDLFTIIACGFYDRLYDTLTSGAEFPIKLWQVRRQLAVIDECYRQNGVEV